MKAIAISACAKTAIEFNLSQKWLPTFGTVELDRQSQHKPNVGQKKAEKKAKEMGPPAPREGSAKGGPTGAEPAREGEPDTGRTRRTG